MPLSQNMEASHPGQMLGLPCPPHLLLNPPSHLPPLGTQSSRLANLVAPVKHAGHACSQAGYREVDS